MNRRQLLALATTLAGSQLLPAALAGNPVSDRLHMLFTHPGLRRLGAQSLTALDCPVNELSGVAGLTNPSGSDQELLDTFTRQRKADFRAGRTKNINGWIMADAECALCALIALA